MTREVPLDLLADCLPYSGAGETEAAHVLDHLADAGWVIVAAPRRQVPGQTCIDGESA